MTVIMNDRYDEAWKVITKLHGLSREEATSPLSTFAREEFNQIKQQVSADKAAASHETVLHLFTKPSYRKRMICAFMTMFAAESTGILVVYSKSC